MSDFDDFIREILSFAFPEPERPEYVCDDPTCVAEIPIEIVLAIVTNRTLDVSPDEIAKLCMFTLRDFAIPMASAAAAVIATAAELKKQHPWLDVVVIPDELADPDMSSRLRRATLYRWYAEMITLHGETMEIRHAEDPDWVRGQKPTEVQEQLLRDGYEHLGEESV